MACLHLQVYVRANRVSYEKKLAFDDKHRLVLKLQSYLCHVLQGTVVTEQGNALNML